MNFDFSDSLEYQYQFCKIKFLIDIVFYNKMQYPTGQKTADYLK